MDCGLFQRSCRLLRLPGRLLGWICRLPCTLLSGRLHDTLALWLCAASLVSDEVYFAVGAEFVLTHNAGKVKATDHGTPATVTTIPDTNSRLLALRFSVLVTGVGLTGEKRGDECGILERHLDRMASEGVHCQPIQCPTGFIESLSAHASSDAISLLR